MGHNFTEARNACYLLDWSDAIIAEGCWDSSDTDLNVHRIPLGQDFMHVWVDVAVVPGAYLFRPNYAMLTIREVVGSTVAWPSQKVIPRGIYLVIWLYNACSTLTDMQSKIMIALLTILDEWYDISWPH